MTKIVLLGGLSYQFKFITIIIMSIKQPPVLNLENYVKQNNLAVDMVCSAIIHERRRGMYPKCIRLNKAYWDMFRKWVFDNYGEETVEKEFFIDHVEIKKETMYSGKRLTIENEILAEA